MGYMGRKSQLKSDIIKKVWLNKKDYKFLDFNFKMEKIDETHGGWNRIFNNYDFIIGVYNCGVKILELGVVEYTGIKNEERFSFAVRYFNPQTDNDCFSINHIIAVCSECVIKRNKSNDMGNADIIKNEFIFRKKKSYYSYVRVWSRGKISEDNYNKQLSYEFATDEYMNYIKNIFEIKKMQRRTIKKNFKTYLDKILILESLK